jgi:hypothetical protein
VGSVQIGVRRLFGAGLIAIPFAASLGLYVDWQHDNAVLYGTAIAITGGLTNDGARASAINHWVYARTGTVENNHYFILPTLGPTPVQVLEWGGDCADKSRLVAAMLDEIDIPAGLVMLAPCRECPFGHTVVEAQYERGRMVVDPIWDIDYPTAGGHFLGVHDLAGTNLGREHLLQLQAQSGPADEIAAMPPAEATFDYAVSVNWHKNTLSRMAAATLRLLSYAPDEMLRPRFLEDPKLALSLLLLGFGIAMIACGLLIRVGRAALRRSRKSGSAHPIPVPATALRMNDGQTGGPPAECRLQIEDARPHATKLAGSVGLRISQPLAHK